MSNKQLPRLAQYTECTGCSACCDACPTNSITMQCYTDKIFYTPVVNLDTCISCNKCTKACVALDDVEKELSFKQRYYCAWNSDMTARMKSTSGGIGTALSKYAVENGYYVCGAAFDENWHLKHMFAHNVTEISKFIGSKYVQSDTNGIYKEILEHLNKSKNVMFIGTPCQIDALYHVVPTRLHHLLLTCEIICHGVNSPKVWEDYVKWLEEKHKAKLESYNFRSKSKGWQRSRGGGNLRVCYQLSDNHMVDEPSWRNQFHYWFGKHYILRPSCLRCKYRKIERYSDITIGDFWNIQNIMPDVDTFSGCSVLITSSAKGAEFVDCVDAIIKIEVNPESAIDCLKGFIEKQTIENSLIARAKVLDFEKEYINSNISAMINRYPHETLISIIIHALRHKLHI